MEAQEVLDPSLGEFSRLPGEIRRMIWKCFTPYVFGSLPRKPDILPPDQNIVQTSRKIYGEVVAEVPQHYANDTFTFVVEPEFKYKPWLKVRDTKGAMWALKDTSDATARAFRDLPWHTLKSVQLKIRAPDPDDCGQVLCLYKKVRDLVDMLKDAKGFQQVEIFFEHSKKASWIHGAVPQRSINLISTEENFNHHTPYIYYTPYNYDTDKDDYEYIMQLFRQLRNVSVVKIHPPRGSDRDEDLLKQLRMMGGAMKRTAPFGTSLDKESKRKDKALQIGLDRTFMAVEQILDTLQSKTADILRLERFSSWYSDKLHGESAYEKELKRLLLQGVAERTAHLYHMNERYRMMRAHNPLSLAFRTAFPDSLKASEQDNIDAKGWNKDEWHRVHVKGIPPLEGDQAKKNYQKWSAEDDAPGKGGQFMKLHHHFAMLIEKSPELNERKQRFYCLRWGFAFYLKIHFPSNV